MGAMMLSCKQVTWLVASDELQSAPFVRRIAVRAHLIMCRHCSAYARWMAKIGELARHWSASNIGHSEDSALNHAIRQKMLMAVREEAERIA